MNLQMCAFHQAAFVLSCCGMAVLRMYIFLSGQFPFEIWFSVICLVLIHTAHEVKASLHWSRQLVFLYCLVHLLQIPLRTAKDGWNRKISGLIDGWSYLNVCTGVLLLGSMDRI